jgi:uncharacterized protein involved in exopolysaccharide biosynthesis
LTATSGYKPQTTKVVSVQRLIEQGETAMQGSIGGFRRRLWYAIGVMLISMGLAFPALAEEKPQYGGIMKVSLSGDPPSLDRAHSHFPGHPVRGEM